MSNYTKRCLFIGFLSVSILPSCSNLGAEDGQKGILARPDMQMDASPLRTALDEHIYFSKEASSGGRGFGGGGCGCN